MTTKVDESQPPPSRASVTIQADTGGRLAIVAAGSWTVRNAASLCPQIEVALEGRSGLVASVDVSGVEHMDTFGACLLERLTQSRGADGRGTDVIGFDLSRRGLVDAVHRAAAPRRAQAVPRSTLSAIPETIGRSLFAGVRDLLVLLALFGALSTALWRVSTGSRRLRLTSIVHHLDRVAFKAVPIIVLITSLVGAIIAQQGIFNFRKFGAETFVVDLVGFLILRELGVLIVAIMVAGRSGSSYTAELGSMKMREEVDALVTMGLDPVEVLVLPRIIAMVLGMPLLAFIGTIAALIGGGLASWLYGGMSPATYVARMNDAVSITQFEVGMIKAPLMAVVIGIVACAEGLQVEGSAESLGLRTTASVVKSIFLVILLDSVCGIIFAAIGM